MWRAPKWNNNTRLHTSSKIDELENQVRQLHQQLGDRRLSMSEYASHVLESAEGSDLLRKSVPEVLALSSAKNPIPDPNPVPGATDPQLDSNTFAQSIATIGDASAVSPLRTSVRPRAGESRALGGVEVSEDEVDALFLV